MLIAYAYNENMPQPEADAWSAILWLRQNLEANALEEAVGENEKAKLMAAIPTGIIGSMIGFIAPPPPWG